MFGELGHRQDFVVTFYALCGRKKDETVTGRVTSRRGRVKTQDSARFGFLNVISIYTG